MRIAIYNARAVLPRRILEGATVIIEDGIIKAIWKEDSGLRRRVYSAINANGNYVSPGFIDTHIHGLPAKIFQKEARFGTTSILPAVSCGSRAALGMYAREVKRFIEKDKLGPNILGIRLEGPFISVEKAGAQDKRHILEPGLKKLLDIIRLSAGLLKMMTVAPERISAPVILKELRKRNIIASIGHSDATCGEALKGIRTGISHATHVFNAMSGLDNLPPGVVGAVLASGKVTAEVILDLAHVHKALFRALIERKGTDRVILVTDSIRSELPGNAAKRGGAYRLRSGRIAGSYLTMNRAIGNACRAGDLSIPEAVRLATLNPARLLGLGKKKGSLGAGKDADIVIFDKRFNVKLTMINGNIVYRARGI